MVTTEQYLGVVAERVQRAGGLLSSVRIGPATAVVGLFTEPVMMSSVPYCVVAAALPEVTAAALHDFTGLATQHARVTMVATAGWAPDAVVIAGLAGARVYPDAAQLASAKAGKQFGSETRMVAVDVTTGQRHTWPGNKFWGAPIGESVSAKLRFCFPQPAELHQQPSGPAPLQFSPPPFQGRQQPQPPHYAPPAPGYPPQGQRPYGY